MKKERPDLYWNYIGGRPLNMGGQVFTVVSPFDSKYKTNVADSNLFDIKVAISKARKSFDNCQDLDFDDRRDVLKKASQKLKFGKSDMEYIVKMTGMPLKRVGEYLQDIQKVLTAVPDLIEKRIGIYGGMIGRNPIQGSNMFKILEPHEGIAYIVTPGNDPRVVAFVSAWLVSLGIPAIFKVSKTDMRIPELVVNSIVEAGYPSGALNILCWDTSNPEKRDLHFKLVDSSQIIWAFGDNETVDKTLRFETHAEAGHQRTIDHFSDKIVLRHASGRAAGIVDSGVDLKKASKMILSSALHWPIGCNSMKALFVVDEVHDDLVEHLKYNFSKLKVGDPMDPKIDVGYINPSNLSTINTRLDQLTRMGLLDIKFGGKLLSNYQLTPILAKTNDVNSEFISTEYPAYVLTTKAVDTYETAVEELNRTALGAKRLAVSVYSNDKHKILKSKIKAHHVKMWGHTTELDLLFHEGQDYLHKLTEPQIHRVA